MCGHYFFIPTYYMSNYDKNKYFAVLIEHGLDLIEDNNEIASNYFLALSEIPSLDDNLKSFCVDAMLIAEGGQTGNIQNLHDLLGEYEKLKPTLSYRKSLDDSEEFLVYPDR